MNSARLFDRGGSVNGDCEEKRGIVNQWNAWSHVQWRVWAESQVPCMGKFPVSFFLSICLSIGINCCRTFACFLNVAGSIIQLGYRRLSKLSKASSLTCIG